MVECDFPGCDKKEALPFRCKYCGKNFCIQHRLPENHDCDKLYLSKSPISKSEENKKPKKKSKDDSIYPSSEHEGFTTYDFNDESLDSTYYTTDSEGQLYSVKPSRRVTKERFLAGIGDAFTIGHESINILISSLIVILSFGFTARFMSNLDWKYVGFLSLIILSSYLAMIIPQKILAYRIGFQSKFVLTKLGLLFSIITIISPIKFVNPGLLVIPEISYMPRKRTAQISITGILIDMSLSICYMFLGIFLNNVLLRALFIAGTFITIQLAILDLLPFNYSNGKRILQWRWPVFLVLVIVSVSVLVVSILFGALGISIV